LKAVRVIARKSRRVDIAEALCMLEAGPGSRIKVNSALIPWGTAPLLAEEARQTQAGSLNV
jgi:hypothetical protein